MKSVLAFCPLVISMLVCCLGCGESVPVGYVTGKVEYQGKPVAADTRVFFEGSGGYIAAGKVDEAGVYRLLHKRAEEIVPGDFVVFVGAPPIYMTEAETRAFEAKVKAEYLERGEKPPASPDWVLPEQYYLPSTSPFRKTVHAGENVVDLILED